MTPRIKESGQDSDLRWFSEALLAQAKIKETEYDLSGEKGVYTLEHPALLKCRHTFENSPGDLTLRTTSSGWNLDYQIPSQAKIYSGFPHELAQFIQAGQPAVLDFKHLGTVFLTMQEVGMPVKAELKHFLLPLWLDYALSAELWGPAGKWTRFHERLHTLFENNGLLIGKDLAGYYPLKKEAQWLANSGFRGKLTQNQFDLILPWDFPLSGLVELEKVLARGP